MTRSVARRPHAVQVEKSSSPESVRRTDKAPAAERMGSGVPWYWQIALFFWVTSFAALLIYEWLLGILKAW